MLRDRRVHPTLPTHDVDALRRFYEDVLGFEPLAVRPGAVLYRAADGTRFAISRSGATSTGGHTQMAFDTPDLEAEVRSLQARGVVFEAYEVPKTVDGIAPMPAGRAAWFKDPDGTLIGLIEFAEPVSGRPRTAQARAISSIDPSGSRGSVASRRSRRRAWRVSGSEAMYSGAGATPPRNGCQ